MKIHRDEQAKTTSFILTDDEMNPGLVRNPKGHTASGLAAQLLIAASRFEDAPVYDGTNMPVCEIWFQDAEPGCPDRIMVG